MIKLICMSGGDPQNEGRGASGRRGIMQILLLFFNLCALFFQTATKFLGQIVTKLFGSNYLMKGKCQVFLLA